MELLKPKTRAAVLALARWQEGVLESPSGSNRVKYNTAYYGRGVSGNAYPWCMAFVWWVFREAGFHLYKTASCTAFVNRYRVFSPGQIISGGFQPGDIVFFDFSGKRKKTEHCGIVMEADGDSVVTVEGNTSTNSNANGGAVMRRTRSVKLITVGVRPGYSDVIGGA